MEEQILVVPTRLFHELGHFQGFSTEIERYREALLAPENVLFLPRSEAENDPTHKQLIPYIIFCHTMPDGGIEIFRYVRGKGVGEQRLRSKQSIGVGGHISKIDLGNGDIYREGMRRELAEEVVIESDYTESCIGLINDDETEVGKVHLGIVHRINLERPNVVSNEPDLIESGFAPLETMLEDLSGFETWSAITLEAVFGKNR